MGGRRRCSHFSVRPEDDPHPALAPPSLSTPRAQQTLSPADPGALLVMKTTPRILGQIWNDVFYTQIVGMADCSQLGVGRGCSCSPGCLCIVCDSPGSSKLGPGYEIWYFHTSRECHNKTRHWCSLRLGLMLSPIKPTVSNQV